MNQTRNGNILDSLNSPLTGNFCVVHGTKNDKIEIEQFELKQLSQLTKPLPDLF